MPETIETLRKRHKREERTLVREALIASGYRIGKAAPMLGVVKSTCQSLIRRHGLARVYASRSPGAGRPAKASV